MPCENCFVNQHTHTQDKCFLTTLCDLTSWWSCLCSPALIKYIRPVFVSRSDQDSRRKTVEEIKRRAQSGGEWPQVPSHTIADVFLRYATCALFSLLLLSQRCLKPYSKHFYKWRVDSHFFHITSYCGPVISLYRVIVSVLFITVSFKDFTLCGVVN